MTLRTGVQRAPSWKNRIAGTGITIAVAGLAMTLVEPANAQTIDTLARDTTQHFSSAFAYGLNTICFIGGALLMLGAAVGIYQHQKNPNSVRPGYLIAGGLIGAVVFAFPYMAGVMTRSVTGQSISATGAQQAMTFTQ
ncbi:hypothetical protein HLH33_09965 [Gluconacetobacter diazotrophicus]|uniref:Uncharacterized protein n=1 Tax=Gluconacetobacter diazotrophicus TaxID=33996 RepID=A0A7W4FF64_GLUDI|nr:hypothetical protein [Gluconacetobacter diazotrophicus]MBB2156630.1 hypothetical protein [Gluconacetobacter diazotrophicus]